MGGLRLTGGAPLDELQLAVRHAVVDDAPRLFDLISAIDRHDFGDVDMTVEEVRDDLAGYDLANDSWLVYQSREDGESLVAFAAVEARGDAEYRGHAHQLHDFVRSNADGSQ